ncbi:MAG: hypothetical protein ACLSG5_06090 [Oscillospiraceae bacterium]
MKQADAVIEAAIAFAMAAVKSETALLWISAHAGNSGALYAIWGF